MQEATGGNLGIGSLHQTITADLNVSPLRESEALQRRRQSVLQSKGHECGGRQREQDRTPLQACEIKRVSDFILTQRADIDVNSDCTLT